MTGRRSRYFLDAALVGHQVAFEFDGLSKFGSDEEWSGHSRNFLRRQNHLRGAGWTVIRLTWEDVTAPTRAFTILRQGLAPFNVCRPAPGGLLWRG